MKYTDEELTQVVERVNDLTDVSNDLVNSEYDQRQDIERLKELLYDVIITLKSNGYMTKDADNTMHNHYKDEAWAEQSNKQ